MSAPAPIIYLDNAATTRVSSECADAALSAMRDVWGNPSSTHHLGAAAADLVKSCRSVLGRELCVEADRIFFTSGGTESNNTAILGGARAMNRRGKRVITSLAEHSSVLDSVKRLEKEGFDCVYLKPDSFGRVPAQAVEEVLTPDTVLLSLMLVNNETGAVNPIKEISSILKRRCPQALFHCDAVAAFGKLKIRPKELGCDALSLSGHKISAPKGIGALYTAKSSASKFLPLHYGGAQQAGFRPGTEPVSLIAALAEAVRQLPAADKRLHTETGLNEYLRKLFLSDEFRSLAPDSVIISPDDACHSVLSMATGCIKSEVMLNYLSARNIYISSGSACSKGRTSHVLEALSLPSYISGSALRISFCRENTCADADALYTAMTDALKTLVRFR